MKTMARTRRVAAAAAAVVTPRTLKAVKTNIAISIEREWQSIIFARLFDVIIKNYFVYYNQLL